MSIQKQKSYSDTLLTRKRLDPDLRRAQLLKHAIAAFADAGIERAAHADVASRAKVSTPTVFKYFPSREILVNDVLDEVVHTFENLRDKISVQASSTPKLIQAMTAAVSDLCVENPDLVKVALAWSVSFSPVRKRYLSYEMQKLNQLSEAFHLNISNNADKRILYATINSFARMHFDGTGAADRQEYIDRVCELMADISLNKSST